MIKNKITAVLGPTNTGKTHLAIETMLSFDSGMIGFPLRLLAREVYDKVIKKFKIYKYFLNKKNIGFSKAANQGIKECDTEYLFILGPRTAVILFLVISIFSILFFLPTRYCWC